MEVMMRMFNERVSELKNSMLLRAEGTSESTEKILVELRHAISELETHVSYMTTFLQEEKAAIERAQEMKEKLKVQHEHLKSISRHLPKHLPGNLRDIFVETSKQQSNLPRMLFNRNVLEDVSQIYHERLPQPVVLSQLTRSTTALSFLISYLTVPDFENVPKYIANRLTRDKVNEAIDDLNKLLADKYRILKMNPSSMNQSLKARYWEYKEAINEETKGKYFITENDLKINNLKINFKLDVAGRAILAILRHVGKLKEVRGGGQTRYVVL
ncbi:hypothetical protein G9A89_012916 [Geosiphon pyriformis]|nr:hypothetical protein G9A89_012916 [Geosiphon pyriformis]